MDVSQISTGALREAVPVPLLLLDDSLRIVDANATFCRTFLLNRQDVENHLIEDLIGTARNLLESAIAGDTPLDFQSELVFLKNEARTLLVHTRLIVASLIAPSAILLLIEDISQRQHREEIRDRLVALIESSEDAIISRALDGTIVTWNSAATRLFGYSEEEALGQSIFVLLPLELRDEEAKLLDRVRRGEQFIDHETVRIRKNGERVDISITISPIYDKTGQVIGISKIAREITRRKREQTRLRTLLDSAPDAMVIVNDEGNIILINAQTQNMFRYTSEELIGLPVETLIPKRFRQQHGDHRAGYFEHPRIRPMGVNQELYGLRKDGSEFPVEISLSPVHSEDGLLGSAAVRDITERKRNEELRVALEREKNLNEMKSHFVSMISHEFRTPMAVIQTSAELIQHHSDQMSLQRRNEHLTLIQDRVWHLTTLLDDILILSKAQMVGLEFNPVWIDLELLCKQIIKTLQSNGQESRIKLTIENALSLEIWGDPKLLTQAITNLLTNALKYSSARSAVQLDVVRGEQSTIFRVRDAGIGIPEAELPVLFQLFHRASNVGAISGTGLGLAIVKEAVEAHGGTVSVESQISVGTTFTLTVPTL